MSSGRPGPSRRRFDTEDDDFYDYAKKPSKVQSTSCKGQTAGEGGKKRGKTAGDDFHHTDYTNVRPAEILAQSSMTIGRRSRWHAENAPLPPSAMSSRYNDQSAWFNRNNGGSEFGDRVRRVIPNSQSFHRQYGTSGRGGMQRGGGVDRAVHGFSDGVSNSTLRTMVTDGRVVRIPPNLLQSVREVVSERAVVWRVTSDAALLIPVLYWHTHSEETWLLADRQYTMFDHLRTGTGDYRAPLSLKQVLFPGDLVSVSINGNAFLYDRVVLVYCVRPVRLYSTDAVQSAVMPFLTALHVDSLPQGAIVTALFKQRLTTEHAPDEMMYFAECRLLYDGRRVLISGQAMLEKQFIMQLAFAAEDEGIVPMPPSNPDEPMLMNSELQLATVKSLRNNRHLKREHPLAPVVDDVNVARHPMKLELNCAILVTLLDIQRFDDGDLPKMKQADGTGLPPYDQLAIRVQSAMCTDTIDLHRGFARVYELPDVRDEEHHQFITLHDVIGGEHQYTSSSSCTSTIVVDVATDLPGVQSMVPPLKVGDNVIYTACRQFPNIGHGEWRATEVKRATDGGVYETETTPNYDIPEYLIDIASPSAAMPSCVRVASLEDVKYEDEEETQAWVNEMNRNEARGHMADLLQTGDRDDAEPSTVRRVVSGDLLMNMTLEEETSPRVQSTASSTSITRLSPSTTGHRTPKE